MLQNRPGFEEFQRSASPNFHSMGFPQGPFDEPVKAPAKDEAIPIKVIHEKLPSQHHKYSGNHSKTADLPQHSQMQNSPSSGSPRVTRAHSEPPKMFNQRLMKTKIPLGNVSESDKEDSSLNNNLSTSASDPSVPNQRPASPQQPQPPPRRGKAAEAAPEPPQHQPQVRHIPIFVEGRDKPVINTPDQQQQPPQQQHKRPANVKLAAPKAPKGEPTSPLSPIPSDQPIPMGYTETDSDQNKNCEQKEEPQPIPLPCSPDLVAAAPSQKEEEAPKEASSDPCLSQLAKIQANVADLVKQIDNFSGSKDSKEYKYLDEMLTRQIIALDGIETGGREDVRQQRKESIRSINRCLSILESKACADQAAKNNEILSDLASTK